VVVVVAVAVAEHVTAVASRPGRRQASGMAEDDPPDEKDALTVPIDGTLDLHTFSPREVRDVVVEYLHACRARGILEVRVVHGKGIGELRRQVHTTLERMPEVARFALAGEGAGGWGATLVWLRPA
jgi:DNA-nicking Smr family endonuclease